MIDNRIMKLAQYLLSTGTKSPTTNGKKCPSVHVCDAKITVINNLITITYHFVLVRCQVTNRTTRVEMKYCCPYMATKLFKSDVYCFNSK